MTAYYKAGGIYLPNAPVMVGAGACKDPASTRRWLSTTAVVSGSYTPEPRLGNQGNVIYPASLEEFLATGYALNSLGLPNIGFERAAKTFSGEVHSHPLIVSVAGFSVDDYVAGVHAFSFVPGVQAIEINLSCPNVQHAGIISYDRLVLSTILAALATLAPTLSVPLWLKLSPYANPLEIRNVAAVINDAYAAGCPIAAVVTCNTFPSAWTEEANITSNGGLAGLSGPALQPIALGQVKQLRQHCHENIDIIGVGGITTGNDVMKFLAAGATAVQLTSLPYYLGSPRSFWELLQCEETGSKLIDYLEGGQTGLPQP